MLVATAQRVISPLMHLEEIRDIITVGVKNAIELIEVVQ